MIVRTEAIVLRKVNFGETSQIVTLFTRKMGTVAVMAKGARGTKSRFGSALRPMSHVQAVFYFKPSREVQTLSECSHLTLFNRLYRELDRMSVGIRLIETVTAVFPRPEPDEMTFDTLLEVLTILDRSDDQWSNLLPFFQLRLCASLGFAPMVDRDAVKQIGKEGGFVSLEDGSVSKTKPGNASVAASRRTIRAIGVLVHADLATSLRMELDRPTFLEVLETIEAYLKYHVEDFRPSRSQAVFEKILG